MDKMSHSDVLKLLFPVPLEGVFAQDAAIEGAHMDAAQTSGAELMAEAFPDTSVALIASWERATGITWPDGAPPLQVRQAAVISKLRSVGGLSAAYFMEIAAAFGWTITITEMQPAMAGIARAGDTLYVPGICFCWKVKAAGTVFYARAGQTCAGEPLTWWQPNAQLEALLNALKPAHTYIIFDYS